MRISPHSLVPKPQQASEKLVRRRRITAQHLMSILRARLYVLNVVSDIYVPAREGDDFITQVCVDNFHHSAGRIGIPFLKQTFDI